MRLLLVGLLICLMLELASSEPRKNVLFLVADDMRPELGAYYGPDFPSPVHPNMRTPHLDALAKRSLLLKRAYVQQALCSPSRTSLLTGRRPDTTRVYDLYNYFRHIGGNFTTIPQYFKEHGYTTAGIGKVFHPGHASNNDDPISWTEPYFHGKNLWPEYDSISWKAVKDELLKDRPLQDQLNAQQAVKSLKQLAPAAKSGKKPFFLAVGFHRPHLPWVVPQSYLDMYPMEEIRLPQPKYLPEVYPEVAWSDFADLRNYHDMRKFTIGNMYNISFPDDLVKTLRRAYYASTSYTDGLVGQVIQTLNDLDLQNDTIISFWGDHGWQLGEHSVWCKHNNFDLAAHAPMMISVPGKTEKGISTEALTEFVDLFPTLAEAADLPPVPLCPRNSANVPVCTEGVSLMPLIQDPKRKWKTAAFSQYPRLDIGGSVVMGYSIRTNNYRYTAWVDYDYPSFTAHMNSLYPFMTSAELYEHDKDPSESVNRINDPNYRSVKAELHKMLVDGWRNALPPSELKKIDYV